MSDRKATICAECQHRRRGFASIPQPIGPSQLEFEICAARPITPGKVDPVTGARDFDRGTACREINVDGNCPDYQPRKMQPGDAVLTAAVAAILALIGVFFALLIGSG